MTKCNFSLQCLLTCLIGFLVLFRHTHYYLGREPNRMVFNGTIKSFSLVQGLAPRNSTIKDLHELFSAFQDSRFGHVTVLILADIPLNSRAFCHCLNRDQRLVKLLRQEVLFPFQIHCPCPSDSEFISLSVSGEASETTKAVEIIKEQRDEQKVAICLAPIFGAYPYWLLFLQFIQWHRLLGVGKFFVYRLDAEDLLLEHLLSYYQGISGLIELINLPKSDANCVRTHRCRHNFQLQDCLHRTRTEGFRYASAIDIDELLVPKRNTLLEFAESLDNDQRGSFVLRCRWTPRYDPDPFFLPENNTLNDFLHNSIPLAKYSNTSKPAPRFHTSKTIFKPETVILLGTHYVKISLPLSKPYHVAPEEGFVRHYRNWTSWTTYFQQQVLGFGDFAILPPSERRLEAVISSSECVLKQILNNAQDFHDCN